MGISRKYILLLATTRWGTIGALLQHNNVSLSLICYPTMTSSPSAKPYCILLTKNIAPQKRTTVKGPAEGCKAEE